MKQSVSSFIDKVCSISPGLRTEYRNYVAYWGSDEPLATILLGDFGRRIFDDFKNVDAQINALIFKEIEDVMVSSDELLVTVVATGLIEGLVNQAERIGVWDEIGPMLGERSAYYADAWREF